MFSLFASSIVQVLVVGLLLGAGLPAIFALGVRFTAAGAGGDAEVQPTPAHPAAKVAGYLCFAIVAAAVALGITVIVSSGFGYKVSFEHIIPVLAKK